MRDGQLLTGDVEFGKRFTTPLRTAEVSCSKREENNIVEGKLMVIICLTSASGVTARRRGGHGASTRETAVLPAAAIEGSRARTVRTATRENSLTVSRWGRRRGARSWVDRTRGGRGWRQHRWRRHRGPVQQLGNAEGGTLFLFCPELKSCVIKDGERGT
jgi:hypothetical protein